MAGEQERTTLEVQERGATTAERALLRALDGPPRLIAQRSSVLERFAQQVESLKAQGVVFPERTHREEHSHDW